MAEYYACQVHKITIILSSPLQNKNLTISLYDNILYKDNLNLFMWLYIYLYYSQIEFKQIYYIWAAGEFPTKLLS